MRRGTHAQLQCILVCGRGRNAGRGLDRRRHGQARHSAGGGGLLGAGPSRNIRNRRCGQFQGAGRSTASRCGTWWPSSRAAISPASSPRAPGELRPPKPFRYRDQGSLAIIGRSTAVASLPHLKMTGLPAWLLWAGVHLVTLAGLRNRVLVYVQWVSAWLFNMRGARLMVPELAGLGEAQAQSGTGETRKAAE